MSDSERNEIERLMGEVREIVEPTPPPEHTVKRLQGNYRFMVTGQSLYVERDTEGRLTKIIGPNDTKTIIRNETGRVIRIDEEHEEIIPEFREDQ